MGITPQQFKQMADRVNRVPRPAVPVFEPTFQPTRAAGHQILLGVDPSLRGTGYGVIRLGQPQPEALG